MSPFPQLTLILRFLKPQETFVRDCAGLDADTLWQDAALLVRRYASIPPSVWTSRNERDRM